MKKLMELLENKEVIKGELKFIEMHEKVESCEYMGLEQGHGGDYLYHVKVEDNDRIYSITTGGC